jgi:hypothetical protein
MIVGCYIYEDYGDFSLEKQLADYERHFKNELVHRNIAAQRLSSKRNDIVLGCFEVTDDYLMDALAKRPDLVTEANVSKISEIPECGSNSKSSTLDFIIIMAIDMSRYYRKTICLCERKLYNILHLVPNPAANFRRPI